MHATSRRISIAVIAAVAALSLSAASCSSSNTAGNTGGGGGTTTTNPSVTRPAKQSAKSGGKIIYGLEGETDGWDPTKNRWAISALMVANAIFDPLMAFDANGVAQPYLMETSTHNEDYTVWTGKLRPGVSFQDGTPVNADALMKYNTAITTSQLTGPAARNIDHSEKVDDLTVKTFMKRPWVAFPNLLTAQGGMLPAPAMLDNPQGNEKPIGSGPFSFVEWVKGQKLVTTKNKGYWRKGMPFLDGVTFQPIPEAQSRLQALQSRTVDIAHLSTMVQIESLRTAADAGDLQLIVDVGPQEKTTVMLNTAKAPLDDPRLRRALIMATDQQVIADLGQVDHSKIAQGAFSKASPWYAETPYPAFNTAKAKELVDEIEREKGPITITLSTVPAPEAQQITQSLKQMWEQAGVDVILPGDQEQTKFILSVVTGQFDAVLWRQYGEIDPDSQYHWWISDNASPLGSLGLNFPHIKDAKIDEALNTGRSNPDPAERKAAYTRLQQQMNELSPYVWLSENVWVLGANNDVRDITNGPLPDGKASLPIVNGWHRLTQTWLDN